MKEFSDILPILVSVLTLAVLLIMLKPIFNLSKIIKLFSDEEPAESMDNLPIQQQCEEDDLAVRLAIIGAVSAYLSSENKKSEFVVRRIKRIR